MRAKKLSGKGVRLCQKSRWQGILKGGGKYDQ
jgi:hypothetical protein